VPVWVRPDGVAEALDDMPPRRFPYASILKNGHRVSSREFVELARAQRYRSNYTPEELSKGQHFCDNLNLNVLLEAAELIPPPP
jgi:hypothetical protein